MSRINKIELRRLDDNLCNLEKEMENEEESTTNNNIKYFDTSIVNNISAIYPRSPNLNTSRNDSLDEL